MAEQQYPGLFQPALTLNNKTQMPLLGFGTFLCKTGEIAEALKAAIKYGYRHIDCAAVYANEPEIGQTLADLFKQGTVKRQDLFITSKLAAGKMTPKDVIPALQQTLKELQLDFLDLYLVHLPVPVYFDADKKAKPVRQGGFSLQDVWREMEKAYEQGLAKAIGVSNYPVVLLNDMLNYAKIPPAVNQIERHPYLVQNNLVKFCQDNNIQVTAFASLGAPGLQREQMAATLDDPTVLKLAKKYNKTAAQVLLRWSVETNVIVIPKSVNPERILQNSQIFDFKLTKEEVEELDQLDKHMRTFTQAWMGIPTFA